MQVVRKSNEKLDLPLEDKIELDSNIPKVLWTIVFSYLTDVEQFVLNRLSVFCFTKQSSFRDIISLQRLAVVDELVECLRYLINRYGCTDIKSCLTSAVSVGNTIIVNLLTDYSPDILNNKNFLTDLTVSAALSNSIDTVSFLLENGAKIHQNAVSFSADEGLFDMTRYLHSKGSELTINVLQSAIKHCDQSMISYTYEHISLDGGEAVEMTNLAIEAGDIKCLECILEIDGYLVSDSLVVALSTGNLDIIQLVFNEFSDEIDDYILEYAVENCNIDIVKYVFSEISKRSTHTYYLALQRGDMEIIELVFSEFNNIDDYVFEYAITNCSIDIIKHIFDRLDKCSNNIYNLALQREDVEIIEYIKTLDIGDH